MTVILTACGSTIEQAQPRPTELATASTVDLYAGLGRAEGVVEYARALEADAVGRYLTDRALGDYLASIPGRVEPGLFTEPPSMPGRPAVWPTSLQPCGGDLPPCYVKMRESGGSYSARNNAEPGAACGAWQIIGSTWARYGGYPEACDAPPAVQDAKARELWAGGAGCGHWSAC